MFPVLICVKVRHTFNIENAKLWCSCDAVDPKASQS